LKNSNLKNGLFKPLDRNVRLTPSPPDLFNPLEQKTAQMRGFLLS
jgi:hypothetical protein